MQINCEFEYNLNLIGMITMEIKASLKHIRMSPKKIRLVVDVIRGMETGKALDQLKFANKRAVGPIEKLIKSGIANAINNFELDENNLYIREIRVDEGVTLKRWMPRAYGRATPIRKRSSHIILTLAEIKKSGKKKAQKKKIEAPIKLGEKPREAMDDKQKTTEAKIEKIEEKAPISEKEPVPSTSSLQKGGQAEQVKEIVDPRREGKGKHTKIEGGDRRGFISKMFRRKSG